MSPGVLDGVHNLRFRLFESERTRLDSADKMQEVKSVCYLDRITVRLLHRQLKSSCGKLRTGLQLRIWRRCRELATTPYWHLKFGSHLFEIRAFFQQRLCEIGSLIRELLQHRDAFLTGQFLLLVS